MGIGKLHGLLVDKREVRVTDDKSLREIRAEIEAIEAELEEIRAVRGGIEPDAAPQSETRH